MKKGTTILSRLSVKEIRRFFWLGNKRVHLMKSIKMPPVLKLEWLEEIRQSLCRLPTKTGKQIVEEIRERR